MCDGDFFAPLPAEAVAVLAVPTDRCVRRRRQVVHSDEVPAAWSAVLLAKATSTRKVLSPPTSQLRSAFFLNLLPLEFVSGQRDRRRPTGDLFHRRIDIGKRIADGDRGEQTPLVEKAGSGGACLHWTAFADDANAIRTARSGCPGRAVRRRARAQLMRLHYVADGVAPCRRQAWPCRCRRHGESASREASVLALASCSKTRGSGAEQRHDAQQRHSTATATEEMWHWPVGLCESERHRDAAARKCKQAQPASSKRFEFRAGGGKTNSHRKRLFGRQAFLPSAIRPSNIT